MKFIILSFAIACGAFRAVSAQDLQWDGNQNKTDLISRTGNVGLGSMLFIDSYGIGQIRLNSQGTYFGKIGNPSSQVWSLGWGNDGSTMTPVLSWKTTGTVGIGTTDPYAPLELIKASGNNYLTVMRDALPGNNDSYFYHLLSTNYHILGSNKNGSGVMRKIGFAVGGGDTENDIKMTIDGNGNVGIGTLTPSAGSRLHIYNATGGSWVNLDKANSGQEAGVVFSNTGTAMFYLWSDNSDDNALKISSTGLAGEDDGAPRMEFPKLNKNIHMVESGGNVGIGSASPTSRVQVEGAVYSNATRTNTIFNGWALPDNANYIGTAGYWALRTAVDNSFNLDVYNNNAPRVAMTVLQNGKLGIGTTSPDKELTVKGSIHTSEVLVDLNGPLQGPDYVFEKDYDLLSLAEVESYIKANKHLPEVPSAKEMEANGLNLKEMNLLLLKKVEELTLHLIELEKRDKARQQEIETLMKSNK